MILFLSATPGQNLPQINLGDLLEADKFAHFGVYLLLTLSLFWAFSKHKSLNAKNIIYAILISSGYGILLEIGQYYIFPGRYFELFDIVANISGSIGSLLFLKIFSFK